MSHLSNLLELGLLESSASAFPEASEVLSARASFKSYDLILVRRKLDYPTKEIAA